MLESRSKAQVSDSSLVSNGNFSETLYSSGWALGQATWAKTTSLMTSLTKNPHPQQKKFFLSVD